LNPYAIGKHQPNEDKLIHYKFEEYYQSRSCGKKEMPKKEIKHNKFQENLNDHNEKRNLLQISRMSSIHIWYNHKFERKTKHFKSQNTNDHEEINFML